MNKSQRYLNRNNLKYTCKQCGDKISMSHWSSKQLSVYSSKNRIPVFCNQRCKLSYLHSISFFNKKGKEHPSYKNGSGRGYNYRVRSYFILLLGKSCSICKKKTNHLIIHHKDMNPRNNDINNVQILCNGCHIKLHWKNRKKWKNRKEACQYYKKRNRKEREKMLKETFFSKFKSEEYYRTNQLCDLWNLTRERIRQMRNEGKIKYCKVKGIYLHYLPNNHERQK